jgi:hypothetical protein
LVPKADDKVTEAEVDEPMDAEATGQRKRKRSVKAVDEEKPFFTK